jgi:hypothetical protein
MMEVGDMNAMLKSLKVALVFVLSLTALAVLIYVVVAVYHRVFGTIGGNL